MKRRVAGRLIGPVVIAGILGSGLRWAVGETVANPTATLLVVNTIGSFILGAVLAGPPRRSTRWLAVGFCGGLTTFSGFALAVAERLRDNQPGPALIIGLASFLLAGGGYLLGRRWPGRFDPTPSEALP